MYGQSSKSHHLNLSNCERQKRRKKNHHNPSSDHPVVICALIQLLVLVSEKAEAAAVMLQASHILFYGLSVGKPEELSGLILSLESTCQDLFATGYFESDISDDPLTRADGEMLLQ